jgi:exonuclease SbcC
MLITRVQLSNYKSYANEVFHFPPGTNAIVGANGSGKSSILEAIGFVLFDYSEAAIGSYLREGATEGVALVSVISSLDEREYEVERRFGRTGGRCRVYDVALGRGCVAEGAANVSGWLREHLRIDDGLDLPSLFENTVGVPQGTVTSAFLQTTAARKSVFDPLLQVADYDRARASLGDTARYLGGQIAELQLGIATLRGQVERLPNLRREHTALAQGIGQLEAQLAAQTTALSESEAALQTLNAQDERIRNLAQQTEQLQSRQESQQRLLTAATDALREAEAATEQLAASRSAHEAYLAAESALDALETQRTQRDRLVADSRGLETKNAQVSTRVEQLGRTWDELTTAERRLGELAPLVIHQEGLEARLVVAREQAQRLAEVQRRVHEARDELARAQHDLADKTARRKQVSEMEARLGKLDAKLKELDQKRLDNLERESNHKAELTRLREQSLALEHADSARCPVCEAELTPAHREELLQRNEEQISSRVAALGVLCGRQRTLQEDENALRALRDQVERSLRSLPSARDIEEAQTAVERRVQVLEEGIEEEKPLLDAPDRVQALRADLEELGNPSQEAAQLQVLAKRRPEYERERARAAAEQSRLAQAAATLDGQLAAFASLDHDLGVARAERDRHAEAHTRYLAHQRAAEQRTARAASVRSLEDELETLRAQRASVADRYAGALSAYDAAQHARVKAQVTASQSQVAALGAQMREKQGQQQAIERDIAKLEAMSVELAQNEGAARRAEQLRHLLERVRELLKQAGPEVTRQRVRRISLEASALHAEIMGDHRNRLIWSEDYALTLDVKGQARPFRQFSGGEQMAAALALRLALLRDATGIDVAFFDEPTAHLDPERRANLAEQIMKVKGFSQLFVISHDDSFEQLAQNHVRIVKDESGSHWEKS